MVNVLFIRNNGRLKDRGAVADYPFGVDVSCPYTKPFIGVRIDESTIPDGVVGNPTVRLKLDKLREKYPPTTEKYLDEEGNEQVRVVAGYFDEDGNNTTPFIEITMGDVEYECE